MSFLPLLQAGAAPASGPFGPLGNLLGGPLVPMVLMFAVFYFLLIMPQQRQQKKLRDLVASADKGDEIVTNGGLIGKITQVKEDRFVVQVNEAKLDILKSAIVTVSKPGAAN